MMPGQSSPPTKAQLDKSEREHLEDVVTELRETVEADIKYQFEHTYELDEEQGGENLSGGEADTRTELVAAVEREDDDKSWEEKFERYVMGVGYTVINRLTALRCMEVRGFIDRPVTQFGDSGTTPAAEKLETEEFLGPNEAILEAYDRECERLTDEIEILFDPDSPYSIVDPDVEVFKELCQKLDEVPEAVWRADDVLGWVYEYYNSSKLDALRQKGDREGLDPEDVPPANQFYTPHWVVRMLTDNSLTKMYLESKGELLSTIKGQQNLSTGERKYRDTSPAETPSLTDFSTYLVPTEEEGEAPDFESPEEIRVIDPACGSGHFLLYAFDVLERIWHREHPEIDRADIPEKILQHNLYGVDLDLRACQLAAFNLYLKARSRSEEEGKANFEMPEVGIVCADAKIASVEAVSEVFDEVAGDQQDVRNALEDILDAFEDVQGLGSLLDVKGTLEEEFTIEEQPTLMDAISGPGSLSKFLENLHENVAEHRNGESFLAQDLKSFLRVLVILSQDYDIALMNPPYGSRNRMPENVKLYVEDHYEYSPEFYINFFEVCDRVTKKNGRIGMLVPRSFMFKRSFEDFREDFVGERGAFDFLTEFGLGILDNATVRTAATIVRSGTSMSGTEGTFFRLHDVEKEKKEEVFLESVYGDTFDGDIQRRYERDISEFALVPGAPLSYWVDRNIRSLYDSDVVFDADNARLNRKSAGVVKEGLTSGNNFRFVSYFWEENGESWLPLAKGGNETWTLASIKRLINWENNGNHIKRYDGSYVRNEDYYFQDALTYTYHKEGGRRFGYINKGCIFDHVGKIFIPEMDVWSLLGYANSQLATYLMLCQTPERRWEVGHVAKLPWDSELANLDEIEQRTEKMIGLLTSLRQQDVTSPYFNGPLLLKPLGITTHLPWHQHPHRDSMEGSSLTAFDEEIDEGNSINSLAESSIRFQKDLTQGLIEQAGIIDDIIYEYYGITEETRNEIVREIAARTGADPQKESNEIREIEPSEDISELSKDLVHYLVLDALNETSDGILPITEAGGHQTILKAVESKFENLFGKFSDHRLAEVDQILGDREPKSESYPNLRHWLENDLMEYHLNEFENVPILWKFTTQRLVTDSDGEGFECYVDYHQLDHSVFDKIESQYIDPLKSDLREKRSTANQRRSDSSLSTAEQAEEAEKYKQYESKLAQINEFQEAILELSSTHLYDYENVSTVAANLASKVREFRQRTVERLETLDELVKKMDPDEFEDHFSPTFLERVNENRDEWLDALKDLETACEAYGQGEGVTVEAHLYDLFTYFEDLVGSTHYGSNGIFFMNYYFSKGENFLDAGEPREGLEGEAHLLAELAAETDKDVKLGEEIKAGCNEVSKALPSNWEERALQEVLASEYSPIKKHGVVINIQPLAEHRLVPEAVEDKVL